MIDVFNLHERLDVVFGLAAAAKVEERVFAGKVLAEMLNILTDPRAWTQDYGARDIGNLPVDSLNRHACRWCPLGAFVLARTRLDYNPNMTVTGELALVVLASVVIGASLDGRDYSTIVHRWNDAADTTHVDVVRTISIAGGLLLTAHGQLISQGL